MIIGSTKTVQTNVVPFTKAGDEDIYLGGSLEVPFGIVLEAEAAIRHVRKANFYVVSYTQPEFVNVSEIDGVSVVDAIESVAEATEDPGVAARLRLLAGIANIGAVVKAGSVAKIRWKGHIEGHKWKGDGRLHADIRYTMKRVPTAEDYQKLLLEIAKLSPEATLSDIEPVLKQVEEMVNYFENEPSEAA